MKVLGVVLDRSRGSKTIPRQPVAEDITLAARPAQDRVQSGSADVQSQKHINAVIPPSPNQDREHSHNDAMSTFHNDNFCKARLQTLCSGCLELTTENCG